MSKPTVLERIQELAATGDYDDYLQVEAAISAEFTRRENRNYFEGRDARTEINRLCEEGKAKKSGSG